MTKTVKIKRVSAHHYTATYKDVTGEGRGALSAAHDLRVKLLAHENKPKPASQSQIP